MMTTNQEIINPLKGLSLIVIIFYQLGFLPNGFIVGDLILIITGMTLTQEILRLETPRAACIYLCKRIYRLWLPMALMVLFCLFYWQIFYPSLFSSLLDQQARFALLFAENIQPAIMAEPEQLSLLTVSPLSPLRYISLLAQFIIFWFCVSLPFIKKEIKIKRRLLCALMLFCLGVSVSALFFFPTNTLFLRYDLLTKLYAPMLGGLLALTLHKDYQSTKQTQGLQKVALCLLLMCIVLACIKLNRGDAYLFKGELLFIDILMGSALFLLQMKGNQWLINMLHHTPFLNYFGQQSYTFYLWHWPIILILQQHGENMKLIPVALVVIFIVLNILYYILENSLINLHSALIWILTVVTLVWAMLGFAPAIRIIIMHAVYIIKLLT